MKNDIKSAIGLMAPLSIGDPLNLNCDYSLEKWAEFRWWLKAKQSAKRQPKYISVDVWMGLVNPEENVFVWDYYRQLFTTIIEHGFKILPIMSFHQCGGNIGDTVYLPLPAWFWKKLASLVPSGDVADVKYVSEYGNSSIEYPSAQAIPLALPFFSKMMSAFQAEFSDIAVHIAEINVSCGPAGELRYPSYDSHDGNDQNHKDDNVAGYPHRGTLQCYSAPAKASFLAYVLNKYKTLDKVAEAWGRDRATLPAMIIPPADTGYFFGANEPAYTQYGRDLFDWNNDELLNVGRQVIGEAILVFGSEGAPFAGIDIGAKVPGVHWGMGVVENGAVKLGNRFPELTAGLIRTSGGDWTSDEKGHGYAPIVALFAELQAQSPLSRIVVHFTCLEMDNGREGPEKQSLAHSLVVWFGQEAQRQGVVAKGENALNFTLADRGNWDLIRSVLKPSEGGLYSGLTILRISDVLDGVACEELDRLLAFVERSAEPIPDSATNESAAQGKNPVSEMFDKVASAISGTAGLLDNIGATVRRPGGMTTQPA